MRWVFALALFTACSSSHPDVVCSPDERCGDGIDNDCDGMIDEGCDCTPGDIQACGVGVCAGEQMCLAGTWSECFGGTPSAEICDGKDNDCDGVVDNGDNACGGVCALPGAPGDPCDGPDTDLCKEGTYSCQSLNTLACSDSTDSNVEICGDHIDNNCDGRTDEYCSGARLLWEDHGGSVVTGSFAEAKDVAVASDGSIYLVGTHQHDATFGGTVTWDAGGSSDGFIVKYSSTGQLIWHQAITGPGDASVTAIAIASDGTLVVVGTFGGTSSPADVQFSPTVTRSPLGGLDAFVARYTADGAFVDVATFASDDDDTIAALAISPGGRIAITGQFYGTALQLGTNSIPRSNYNMTYFAAELDASFTPLWVRRVEWSGTTGGDVGGTAVAFDAAGDLYVGGSAACYTNCTTPMLAINRGEADELLVPATVHDRGGGFLARFDSTGAVAWATAPAQVGDLSITGTTLYATGAFYWAATFGAGMPNASNLVAGGSFDAWAGRYETDGTFDWVRGFGSATTCTQIVSVPDDGGLGLAIDAAGNPIVTGIHQSTLVMASDLSLPGSGYGNTFWASFDSAGTLEWAHNGQIGEDPCLGGGSANRVAVAPNGNVVVVGRFNAHMILPTAVLGGPNDFFITVFTSGE